MQIHWNLQQRSDEWHEAKLGKISSSNIDRLLTGKSFPLEGHKTYALELAIERIIENMDENYVSFAMQKGIEREPYMREIYENSRGVEVKEVGGISDGDLWYSPDGLVGDDGLIEIKCPEIKQHAINLMSKTAPEIYLPQIQFGLMVSGRKWCDLCTFNPNFPDNLKAKVFRIERDNEYIANIQERIEGLKGLIDGYLTKLTAI